MAELKLRRMKFYHFGITVFFIFCSISLICSLIFILFCSDTFQVRTCVLEYSTDSYASNCTQLTLLSNLEIELFGRYYKTRTNIIGIVIRSHI